MSFKNLVAWHRKTLLTPGNASYQYWLRDRSSLTARLQAKGTFSVHLLYQGLDIPTFDEAIAMGIKRGRLAWVRDVALICNRKPVVFAHTVLPYRPRGPVTDWLAHLGNRSLGALLFAHPGFSRGEIRCKRIDHRHALFRPAIEAMQCLENTPKYLWARRSRFGFKNQAVLVTEVFSPDLLNS